MRFRTLTAMLSVTVVAAMANGDDTPIAIRSFVRETPAGPARIFEARIDLANPKIEVLVTEPVSQTLKHRDADSIALPTDRWAASVGATVAINANYFGKLAEGETNTLGLSVSDGRIVSPVREYAGAFDPSLVFTKDRIAKIGVFNGDQAQDAWDAVAGIGASPTDPDHGGLLVENGKNRGERARIDPEIRHPRTAAGVSADGRTLWLVVVDGRQPGYSVGMTLPELGDLMIELGADDALNLDGGGSSAFVARDSAGEVVLNKPSDGAFRPVANHLGFKLADSDPSARNAHSASLDEPRK